MNKKKHYRRTKQEILADIALEREIQEVAKRYNRNDMHNASVNNIRELIEEYTMSYEYEACNAEISD